MTNITEIGSAEAMEASSDLVMLCNPGQPARMVWIDNITAIIGESQVREYYPSDDASVIICYMDYIGRPPCRSYYDASVNSLDTFHGQIYVISNRNGTYSLDDAQVEKWMQIFREPLDLSKIHEPERTTLGEEHHLCASDITFYVPFEYADELKRLDLMLSTIINRPSDGEDENSSKGFRKIIRACELDVPEDQYRGWISMLCDIDIEVDAKEAFYSIWTYDVDYTKTEMWDMLLKEYYPHVQYVYKTVCLEERFYVNTDERGVYYPIRYEMILEPENGCRSFYKYKTLEGLLHKAHKLFERDFQTIDELIDYSKDLPGYEECRIIVYQAEPETEVLNA